MLISATIARRAFGAMLLSAFGAIWLAAWSWQYFARRPLPLLLIALVFLLLFGAFWRHYRRHRPALALAFAHPQQQRNRRMFRWINLGQWLAICLLVVVLNRLGLPQWTVPAVILMIGLHFIPLGRLYAYPFHYVTGVALVLVAIGYPLLAAGGAGDHVGMLLTGLVLWASALRTVTLLPQAGMG